MSQVLAFEEREQHPRSAGPDNRELRFDPGGAEGARVAPGLRRQAAILVLGLPAVSVAQAENRDLLGSPHRAMLARRIGPWARSRTSASCLTTNRVLTSTATLIWASTGRWPPTC